jgi:CRP/FNR family transcriptional regulator
MNTSVDKHITAIMKLFPDFIDIPIDVWEAADISVREIEPSHMIPEGLLLDHAVFVLDGTVRMFKLSASGREITLYRISDGECCPLMSSSLLGETEYEASACTETPCLALFTPAEIFREWFDTYKRFRQFIFQSICKRIITLSKLLDTINFKSIRGRVVEFLLQAAHDNQSNVIVTTHDTLATELGSAREVISRTLKQLKQEQLISLTRGKITIVDYKGLEALVEE